MLSIAVDETLDIDIEDGKLLDICETVCTCEEKQSVFV